MNNTISKGSRWAARVISGLVVLFMLFDSVSKLLKPAVIVDGTLILGFSEHHIGIIGTLGLISTILFAIPRTTVLGAILLTGYFGGAIATHLRLDNPLLSHVLFPVYLAILVWGAIWFRDKRLRRLLPFILTQTYASNGNLEHAETIQRTKQG